MSVVLPRLDRTAALEIVRRLGHLPLGSISAAMPELTAIVTYSPVGGARIETSRLHSARNDMLGLAREHGMPDTVPRWPQFESAAARLLHDTLPLTPHEASQEEVWSYLTCCWLLDVAIWRFGADGRDDRFYGHVNRNTFRRMWWRAEILGSEVDLARLGEDEIVAIMERPTLFQDVRVARSIALEFLERAGRDVIGGRMMLMREATKRLLRLTPFVSLSALADDDVRVVVADAFDVAAAGLRGDPSTMPVRQRATAPSAAMDLTPIPRLSIVGPDGAEPDREAVGRPTADDLGEVAQAAIDIARRTGRVTNGALREVVPITSDEAREVFKVLMERGDLVRRGVKRGTHYVLAGSSIASGSRMEADQDLPESSAAESDNGAVRGPVPVPDQGAALSPASGGDTASSTRLGRAAEDSTALRRLLRRVR